MTSAAPAGLETLGQLLHDRRIVAGDVHVLRRIGLVIVQLDRHLGVRILPADPARQPIAFGAHAVAHHVAARVLAEGRRFHLRRRILQQGDEARSLQVTRQRQAGQLTERGIDVDELRERARSVDRL